MEHSEEKMPARRKIFAEAAEMFGEMRHLTEEESEAYADMLHRLGMPTGISLFDHEDSGDEASQE